MIQNDVSNVTAHVANWFFYSGWIDPAKIYDDAVEVARQRKDDEDFYEIVFYELESTLQHRFEAAFDEAMPHDLCPFGLDSLPGPIGHREEHYQAATPAWLFATLLAPALESINWTDVAELLIKHVAPQYTTAA